MKYKQLIVLGVICSVAFLYPMVRSHAQETSSASAYQLPYPGMLPNNPLYFLKVIRDDLTFIFIGKPLDKVAFDLQQSDKNVQASYLLMQQGKIDLSLQTFSQSQDYFQETLAQAVNAKKQGYSIQMLSKKFIEAQQKHMQIFKALKKQKDQKNAQLLQNERIREEQFAKQVKTLR